MNTNHSYRADYFTDRYGNLKLKVRQITRGEWVSETTIKAFTLTDKTGQGWTLAKIERLLADHGFTPRTPWRYLEGARQHRVMLDRSA